MKETNDPAPTSTICRICGGSAGVAFRRLGWDYARCRSCAGLSKVLTEQAYSDLRPSYDPGPEVATTSEALVRKYLHVDTKLGLLRKLLVDAPGAKRFLDIGCGAGGYLLAAQELGLQATGVEPSKSHSTIARQLGLNVIDGYFSADRFEDEPFDIVLLSHVIEHIYDPPTFLAQCLRVLRSGGILCVVTPNADSLLARMSGRYWVMLKPVDHVTMFTAKSFREPSIAGLGLYKLEQSEYAWEPLISLAAAGRDCLRPVLNALHEAQGGGASATGAPSTISWNDELSLFRKLATGVGLPLHVASRATDREATLVAHFRRQ